MSSLSNKEFGQIVSKLINKENLSNAEAYTAFTSVLNNETTDIQQGAFLAALTAKGETKEEIAACYKAIYECDTVKVAPLITKDIVENSGTGMDSFKTFNVSTLASLVAATAGIPMARHGARALSSKIGTVDIAEHLGVNVECDLEKVVKSIETCNIGLFNGMSPKTHPMALGRILSQISFGTTLNISASLANPVKVTIGVRGVYKPEMIIPTIEVMKEIGYKKAIVFCGEVGDGLYIDEVSNCGITHFAEFDKDAIINEFKLSPSELGVNKANKENIATSGNVEFEKKQFIELIYGTGNQSKTDIVAINAAVILYIYGVCSSIKEGAEKALEIINSGKALDTLNRWIEIQS